MYKLDLQKGRGTRDQIANIHWIIEKVRQFQRNIYFWFIDYTKAFDCVYHNKLWKVLKEMEIPDHPTCQETAYSSSLEISFSVCVDFYFLIGALNMRFMLNIFLSAQYCIVITIGTIL